MFKGKKFWDIAQGKDAQRLKNYSSWIYDKHKKGEWDFYGTAGKELKAAMVEYLTIPQNLHKLPF